MQSLIQEVRESTQALHQATETLLLPSLDGIGKEQYSYFLQCNLLFHRSFEPMVSRTGFSNCYEWRAYDRRKYDRLQQDIVNMGVMPMAGWESSFQMWPEAKLLGAAYVSEGSSLGGKVILKHLRKQAFFKENQIGTFLSSNSEKTGEAWKAFVSLLEREGAADHEGVISGAVEAFEMFIQIAEQVKQKRK